VSPRTLALAAAVVLSFLLPAAAGAQGRADVTAAVATRDVGPSLAASSIAFHEPLAPRDATSTAFDGNVLKNGPVLMIVGGAALIIGLIIGDTGGDILAVAGGLVGLYGLYVFLSNKNKMTELDPSGAAVTAALPAERQVGIGYRITLPR